MVGYYDSFEFEADFMTSRGSSDLASTVEEFYGANSMTPPVINVIF